jgi:hypothetical protein
VDVGDVARADQTDGQTGQLFRHVIPYSALLEFG